MAQPGVLMILAVFVGVLLLCLALRMQILLATFIAGATAIFLWFRGPATTTLSNLSIQSTYTFTLVAIPLFVLMGTIMGESGLSTRIFNGLAPLCSRIPGGLLNVIVIFSAIFAAMCGSGSASIAAIGTVVYPEFKRRTQYNMTQVLGTIAASSNLGPIIPPSLILIIYGSIVGESVGALFIGGIVPGALLAFLFISYIMLNHIVRHKTNLEPKAPWKQVITAPIQMYPVVVLIFLALVSIYLGIATPSEAAALGAMGALIISIAYKDLTWKKLRGATRTTVLVSSMMAVVMLAAKIYSFAASYLNIPQMITNAIISSNLSPYIFILIITLIGLIMGMIGADLLLVLVIAPMIYPIIQTIGGPYGWDGLWLGVFVLFLNCIGALSPPIAAAVFTLAAVTKEKPETIFKGTMPFIGLVVFATILLIFLPKLVTWLPATMITGPR
ncbi:MAG: TRAP transporter large permease subunit [Dehalococcoidales bacterium]|nr:TRAP transporter large permease subunit [Dehalococcoidales bacterium]